MDVLMFPGPPSLCGSRTDRRQKGERFFRGVNAFPCNIPLFRMRYTGGMITEAVRSSGDRQKNAKGEGVVNTIAGARRKSIEEDINAWLEELDSEDKRRVERVFEVLTDNGKTRATRRIYDRARMLFGKAKDLEKAAEEAKERKERYAKIYEELLEENKGAFRSARKMHESVMAYLEDPEKPEHLRHGICVTKKWTSRDDTPAPMIPQLMVGGSSRFPLTFQNNGKWDFQVDRIGWERRDISAVLAYDETHIGRIFKSIEQRNPLELKELAVEVRREGSKTFSLYKDGIFDLIFRILEENAVHALKNPRRLPKDEKKNPVPLSKEEQRKIDDCWRVLKGMDPAPDFDPEREAELRMEQDLLTFF